MFAKEGLEGVVAARTGLSLIDGERGRLSYRGYSIHELAENSSFEEVVHLLWYGELPTRAQLDQTRKDLSSQRGLHADSRAFREANTHQVNSYDEFKQKIDEPGGFFWAHWD